ncbi:uncharacterized protein APUU_70308A [Aspergillus puulaauensis]|uniref:Uncharacterized protein n=1 Tax=Aspergillus puulaauensis TaxID=1220207 RepID=A0A7R7XXG2_9EURO|nr:uncharacterized protein APUU_70308A [Aspergillus puulaauensis]BCS28738.1 hypothetical protein APUU_70308A [Aspergillus puulaauensis]
MRKQAIFTVKYFNQILSSVPVAVCSSINTICKSSTANRNTLDVDGHVKHQPEPKAQHNRPKHCTRKENLAAHNGRNPLLAAKSRQRSNSRPPQQRRPKPPRGQGQHPRRSRCKAPRRVGARLNLRPLIQVRLVRDQHPTQAAARLAAVRCGRGCVLGCSSSIGRIEKSCGPLANAQTRYNGLSTLRKIGKTICLSENTMGREVRKDFKRESELDSVMLQIVQGMGNEERWKVRGDKETDESLWPKLLELKELADPYCVMEGLQGVLDALESGYHEVSHEPNPPA